MAMLQWQRSSGNTALLPLDPFPLQASPVSCPPGMALRLAAESASRNVDSWGALPRMRATEGSGWPLLLARLPAAGGGQER